MYEYDRELLHGNTGTLVLALLARGEWHAYGMRQELIRISGSTLAPSEGNLYPLLAHLQKQKFVRSEYRKCRGKQTRCVYRITPRGRKHLAYRLEVWKRFSKHMTECLHQLRCL